MVSDGRFHDLRHEAVTHVALAADGADFDV